MSLIVNIANNFLEEGTSYLQSETWLNRPDVYLDERNNMFSYNTNFTNDNWYYNYLISNSRYALRNPKAYPTYMLDLGYIPVVFLPSCRAPKAISMISKLDAMNIPYVQTGAYSFVVSKPSLDYTDAWVSKLDIERILGIPLNQITSVETVRRIYG